MIAAEKDLIINVITIWTSCCQLVAASCGFLRQGNKQTTLFAHLGLTVMDGQFLLSSRLGRTSLPSQPSLGQPEHLSSDNILTYLLTFLGTYLYSVITILLMLDLHQTSFENKTSTSTPAFSLYIVP